MALLAVAPAMLIGCSGGSSSNNSTSTVKANIAFGTPENPNVISPTIVKRTFQPQGEFEGGPNYTVGSGVYSYFTPLANLPEGNGVMSNAVLLNNSKEHRFLIIERFVTTATTETVGTVYDIATQNPGTVGIRFSRTVKTNTPPSGGDYLASSGTVTVTAVNGNFITLELKDVVLTAITQEAEPATLQLSGSITYKRNNVVIRPPSVVGAKPTP